MFQGYLGKFLEFVKEMLSTKQLGQIFQSHSIPPTQSKQGLRNKANISKEASADIALGESS